jgi:hypothetical protein
MRPTKQVDLSRPISARSMVDLLAAVGIVASWVEMIVMPAGDSGLSIDLQAPRPPLYYYAHGVALLAVMAAGLLAAASGRLRVLGRGGRFSLLVLTVSAAGWAAVSYSIEELFSRSIFGPAGPFVWFTLIFILVGANHHFWVLIDPLIRVLAYATSLLTFWMLVSARGSVYQPGQFSKPTEYCILLMWLGGWVLLSATRLRGWQMAVRTIPFFSLFLVAIFGQARSWTLLTVLLGVVFVILRAREEGSALAGVKIILFALVILVGIGSITYRSFLGSGLEGLAGRAQEDTRSGEYAAFFSSVPLSELLLGKGPKGTWYWAGAGEFQFADNGFIWMVFTGGLPTLVSYITLVLWPGVTALRAYPRGQAAAAVFLLSLWGLALMGLSTFTLPSLSLSSYLVSLWVGRCYLFLAERASLTGKDPPRDIVGRSPLPCWNRVPATR